MEHLVGMRSYLLTLSLLLLSVGGLFAAEPAVIPVWPDAETASSQPNEEVRVTNEGEHVVTQVHRPTLTAYLPPSGKETGAAVVVCPGGGHRELWMDHEGHRVAQFFAEHGIAAFILKYRLANQENSRYSVEKESLADLQRSLQLVRHRAQQWKIDPARVGVIGFSAGGQLAGLGATRSPVGLTNAGDAVSAENCRPDFQALIYPGHADALKVTKGTPPAFIVGGDADTVTVPSGMVKYYDELHQAGVSAELHLYAGVGHGFGIRESNLSQSRLWPNELYAWLEARGFLKK